MSYNIFDGGKWKETDESDNWGPVTRLYLNQATINPMKTKTKTRKKPVKAPKVNVSEYQAIVDELCKLRTKHIILEDKMENAVSELRNTIAFVSSRTLENWKYEENKKLKKEKCF